MQRTGQATPSLRACNLPPPPPRGSHSSRRRLDPTPEPSGSGENSIFRRRVISRFASSSWPVLLCLPLLAGLAGEAAAVVTVPANETVAEPATHSRVSVTFTGDPGHLGSEHISPSIVAGEGTASGRERYGAISCTAGDDFVINGNNDYIDIDEGETTHTSPVVTICADTVDEPDETFILRWSSVIGNPFDANASNCSFASVCDTTFTITDDDPTEVRLAQVGSATSIYEAQKVEFTVRLGRELIAGETIDVPLSISGTNVTTGDWSLAKKSGATLNTGVTLSDTGTTTPNIRFENTGAQTATLELTATADSVSENAETISIALGSNSDFDAAALGTNVGGGADPHSSENDFDITVNDPLPEITITAGTSPVTEGTAASFTVNANPAPSANLDVSLTVTQSGSFAASGATGTKTVRINANATSATYAVATVNDTADESNGSITAAVDSGTGYTVGSPASASVAVNDDDGATLSLSLGSSSGNEGDSGSRHVDVRLGLSPTRSTNTRFLLCIRSTGTATFRTGAKDFDLTHHRGNTGLTLTAGNCHVYNIGPNGSSSTVSLRIFGDTDVEPDETAVLELRRHANTPSDVRFSPSTATYTIRNDDIPQVTVTGGNAVTEGGDAVFTLSASPAPNGPLAVRLAVGDDAASDFLASAREGTKTVTIPGSGSVSYSVSTVNDSTPEANGTVRARVLGGTGYRVGSPAAATVAVNDDDGATISLGSAAYRVTEGGGVEITLNLDSASPVATTVAITYADGTASRDHTAYHSVLRTGFGKDYEAAPTEVVIPANATSHTFTVRTVDDAATLVQVEADETFTVALGALQAGFAEGTPSTATVTIEDNDKAPDPAPRVSSITRDLPSTETTSFDSLTWQVQFSEDVRNVDAADFRISGTTATLVVESAGILSAYRVKASGGDLAGLDGTVVLSFASGQNIQDTTGNALADTTPTGANEDRFVVFNAAPPPTTPAVSITGGSAVTEGGNAVFTLSASPAPGGTITVSINVADSGDFAGSGQAGPRTVAMSGGSATLTVATVNDSIDETNGSLTATVGTGTGYSVGSPASASVAVNDDDDPPPTTPAVSITGGSAVTEGGNAVFTLSASPAPGGTITVSINVADSGDFAGSGQAGPRTVAMSGGSATLTVATVNDSIDETNGSLTATVGTGTGYSVGSPASASVAVNDDDDPPPNTPVVSISGGSAVTEGVNAVFTLSASPAPSGTITVRVNVVDSGDFAGSGQAGPRTVTMGSGSATLTVTTMDDNTNEPNGRITATVQSGTGYSPSNTNGSASIAVNDDDGTSPPPPPPPAVPEASFETVTSRVSEPTPAHRITVSLDPAPQSAFTLAYTIGGTAASGDDYAALSGTLSVAAGASSAILEVEILQDTEAEGDETILLTLADGSGYALGGRRTHTLTIAGNDRAPQAQDSKVRAPSGRPYTFRLSDFRFTDADGDELKSVTVVSLPVQGELTLEEVAAAAGAEVSRGQLERGELVYTPADDPEGPAAFTFRVNDGSADSDSAEMTLELVDRDAQRLAQGWLARFGRTAADQVIGAVEARLRAAPAPTGESAWQLRLAGRAWQAREASNRPDGPALSERDTVSEAFALPDMRDASPSRMQGDLPPRHETASTGVTRLSDLDWHGGTSFNYTARAGLGLGSVWGRGAVTRFDGREPDARLDARVASVLLGADFVQDGRTLGLLLSHSRGKGGYQGDGDTGHFEAELTGAYPYARIEINERLSLWGVAGYGEGDLEQTEGEETSRTDLDSWMAAGGLRGRLKAGTAAWPELSAVADLLWVDTQADGTQDFASLDAEVSRLRIGLEGTWQEAELGSGHLRPNLRLSLRHDGGDAEHGFGTEVRAGADWTDARRGLTAQLQAHALLTHEEDGVQEKGFSGSLAWDPRPGSLRGAAFSLSARSGAEPDQDGLLAADAFERDPARDTRQWQATLGYGVGAFGDRFTAVPQASVAWSEEAWYAGLGWRLAAEQFDLLLEARHRDASTDGSGFGLDLEMQGRW